ncbi:twin arginine-targeting protein translocase, TatA/E family, putative [Synechococcus sp. PCC 7335]|nr:twin arginine-targeting protein translocase, TatA/E family, putative [Synechococcus sp. PCC 7335]
MNIFGIGLPEMGLIMIVALLVFGPKKLPEIGRSLGKAMKGFQDATKEFETEFKKEAERIEKTVEPMKATLEKPRAISEGKGKDNADKTAKNTSNQGSQAASMTEAEIVETSETEATETKATETKATETKLDESKVAETADESQPA